MRRKTVKKWVCLVVAFMLSAGVACDDTASKTDSGTSIGFATANANLTIKSLLATERYEKTEDVSHLQEGGVTLAAAKGEAEGGQFIVRSNETFKGYTLSVSDLKSGENTISAENVTLSKMLYTYCQDRLNDGVLPQGYYTDAVVPMEYIVKAGENVMEKDVNNSFWVDVDVPKDAIAGEYSGEITISFGGKKKQVPLLVTVYDFAIAELPYTQSLYSIFGDNFLMYGELDSTEEMYMTYYDELLKYNVTAGGLPEDTPEKWVGYVREYYDKISVLRLPYKALTTINNDWEYLERYMKVLVDASVEDNINYYGKALHRMDMFYDEYHQVPWRYNLVRSVVTQTNEVEERVVAYLKETYADKTSEAFIAEMSEDILGLKHCMTATYLEEFSDIVDMLCPQYNYVRSTTADIEEMCRQMKEEGITYWTYGCITHDTYPNPSREVDDFGVSTRDLFWFNYEHDIQGDLFWSVNGYCNYSQQVEGVWKPIDDLYGLATRENLTNGDGYLFYPGAFYESDKPFPSYRLIVTRDGIDDNTYLGMLGDRYAEIADYYGVTITDAKGLAHFLNQQLLGRGASKLNDAGVFRARDTVAKSIELVDKAGLVINRLETVNNTINYEIFAKNGVKITVNGEGVNGIASGQGKVYRGAVAINENGVLTIAVEKNGETFALPIITPEKGEIVMSGINEEETSVFKVDVASGSSVALSENFGVDNGSAEVVLRGRNYWEEYDPNKDYSYDYDGDLFNQSYRPSVRFELTHNGKGAESVSSIEFYVYNAQEADIRVEIFVEKKEGAEVKYDEVRLGAKTWTKVVVDNLNVLELNRSKWGDFVAVGFSIDNLLNGDEEYTQTFYIDELIIRYNEGGKV